MIPQQTPRDGQPTAMLPVYDANESLLLQAVQEYQAALDAGNPPARAAFLERYAAVASDLADCLDNLEFLRSIAPQLADDNGDNEPASVGGATLGRAMLGDFMIVREIGRGGMGTVFEAEQLSMGRRVALKVLPFAALAQDKALQRFRNEVRAAAALDHPNIVSVYFVGEERGVHYYAMQLIRGQSLAQLVDHLRQERLAATPPGVQAASEDRETELAISPPLHPSPVAGRGEGEGCLNTEAVAHATTLPSPSSSLPAFSSRNYFRAIARLGIQAAEALQHAHDLGVLHRDIKPSNLLLECNSKTPSPLGGGSGCSELAVARRGCDDASHLKLYITDFGLARIQSDTAMTMTGDVVGTLRYMAPEQALAKRVVIDHRADIYSLGATLYELLTLRPAFTETDRSELLKKLAFEEPRALRKIDRYIPAELETIVLKAMAKNPDERYQTAQQLADDLGRFLNDQPIKAKPPSLVSAARKWSRRHRPIVWATAATLLICLITVAASVGWVFRDRAARRAVAEASANFPLEQAVRSLEEANWTQALAAAERAEALLASTGYDSSLASRVRDVRQASEMAARLDEIRLNRAAAGREGQSFDYSGTINKYAEAFRQYGIDVDALPTAQAAERIKASLIWDQLVAALDDWAQLLRSAGRTADSAAPLLAVARAVDQDPWRNRLRESLQQADRAAQRDALVQLAQSADGVTLSPASVERLARALLSTGSYEEAETLLRAAQRRHSIDFWINFDLADCLLRLKRTDEAARFYTVALALRPDSPTVSVDLGYALFVNDQLDEAIACYEEGLRIKPDYLTLHTNLANALRNKAGTDAIIAWYRTYLQENPEALIGHVMLGQALREKGDRVEADHHFREAMLLRPESAEGLNNLAAAFGVCRAIEEAIRCSREAIALKPDSAEAHFRLAGALDEKLEQLDEAINHYREALRLRPEYPEAYLGLGIALARNGRPDDAIANFREAIRLKPDYALAYQNIGVAFATKGQLDESIANYREVVRLAPSFSGAYCSLGVILAEQGQFDEALINFREAIRLAHGDPIPYHSLGACFHKQGKLDEAIESYREALRLRPPADNAAKTYSNLGLAYYEQGKLDEAIASSRKAVELNPEDANAHNNLGVALGANGDLDAAIASHKKAILLEPGVAGPHMNLGNRLKEKGLLDDAIASHREAIRLDPMFSKAHCSIGCAFQAKGLLDEAIASYRKAIELNP